MAKVISRALTKEACPHKHVIAHTGSRTVCCVLCGASFDPFDVLVDMISGSAPDGRQG